MQRKIKNIFNFKVISLILMVVLVVNIALFGCLAPKRQPAQATAVQDVLGFPVAIGQWIWDQGKTAVEWAKDTYNAMPGWIRLSMELAAKSESWLAKAVRIAAYVMMHQILNMITNDIINWINGGGKPRFVTNWKNFLQTAADKAAGAFLNELAGINLCEPFRLDLQIALLPTTNFPEDVSCSFSEMGRFFDDFRDGGWKGWVKITSPENNFFGAYFKGVDQRMSAESAAAEEAQNEGIASKGFLGVRCSAEMAAEGKCKAGQIITPGDAISYTTNKAINQPWEDLSRQMADLTDSLGTFAPYVIAIANALINRVITEGLAMVIGDDEAITDPRSYINIPTPDGSLVAQINNDKSFGSALVEQQKNYATTINDEILPAQRDNLAVLIRTENVEKQILDVVLAAELREEPCSLGVSYTYDVDPANPTITSTENGVTTIIAPYILNVANVGTMDVTKTTVITETSTRSSTKVTAYYPSTNVETVALQEKISNSIAQIDNLTSAANKVNEYLTWINTYGGDINITPTELDALSAEEQDDLGNLKVEGNEYRLEAVILSQDVINSTSADFSTLAQETQQASLEDIQEIETLKLATGTDTAGFETGLYKELADANALLATLNSQLISCQESLF